MFVATVAAVIVDVREAALPKRSSAFLIRNLSFRRLENVFALGIEPVPFSQIVRRHRSQRTQHDCVIKKNVVHDYVVRVQCCLTFKL